MPNPLRKEKVIEFVKRYPHESGFELLNSSKSIIVRPGEEQGNEEVGDSNLPNSFAQCNVGLEGTQGNPEDFNTLLSMWKDEDERPKLNPLALMRLWASIYRTYFGWVKITQRLFPTSSSNLSIVTARLNPALDYSVRFDDGLGNISTWDPTLNAVTGFVEAYHQGASEGQGATGSGTATGGINLYIDSTKTTNGVTKRILGGRLIQLPIGSFSNPQNGEINVIGEPSRLGIVTKHFNNSSTINTGIIGGETHLPFFNGTEYSYYYGVATSATPVSISEIILTTNSSTPFTNPPNSSTSIAYIKVQKPYNLTTPMSVGPYKLVLTFNDPIVLENLVIPFRIIEPLPGATLNYPSGSSIPTLNAYVLKTSADGITYDQEINYGNYYSLYNTSTTSIYGIPSVNSHGTNDAVMPNARNFNAYITQIYTRNTPAGTYTGVPTYTTNQTIIGHQAISVPITKNGVDQTATFRAYVSTTNRSTTGYTQTASIAPTQESPDYLLMLNNITPKVFQTRRVWELVDQDNEVIIMGFFDFALMNPNRTIKSLQIEYGPNNAGNNTSLFLGYKHPVVIGTKQAISTTSSSELLTYSQVDFDNQYYTDTNPENYTITGTRIDDIIAQNAYSNTTFSNKVKWKFLPLTLPYTTPLLRTAINNIDFLLTDLEIGFDFEEDYLDNTMLRLPDDEAEWNTHLTLSNQLQKNPTVYWMRLRANELLNELINYCKGTCLKFWRINRQFSVSNYLDYTRLNLDIQPETRDIRTLPGTIGTTLSDQNLKLGAENFSIQTYLIQSGSVDIEDNPSPGELWFLSGGGYTSVDLASNILSEYIDNLLSQGSSGNTAQNPNLL